MSTRSPWSKQRIDLRGSRSPDLIPSAPIDRVRCGRCSRFVERKNGGMAKRMTKPTQKMQAWIEARKRHRLSHAQVHMARELGMNPAKLGKIDNHKQEPWKLPLPQFIEELYFKRFGKTAPEAVLSVEEQWRREAAKKEESRIARERVVDSATPHEAPPRDMLG